MAAGSRSSGLSFSRAWGYWGFRTQQGLGVLSCGLLGLGSGACTRLRVWDVRIEGKRCGPCFM